MLLFFLLQVSRRTFAGCEWRNAWTPRDFMGDVIKATVNFLNALHLSIVIILLYIYLFFHLPMNISVNNLPGVLLLSIRTPIAFAAFVREHRTRRLLRACRPPPPSLLPLLLLLLPSPRSSPPASSFLPALCLHVLFPFFWRYLCATDAAPLWAVFTARICFSLVIRR